jgi:hypothetical protein
MLIRHLALTLGTFVLLSPPALAEAETYPLAPFRAGPVPVMLRVAALPLAVEERAGGFSLPDLSPETLDFALAEPPAGAAALRPRIAIPRDSKAAGGDVGKGLGGDTEETPPAPGSFGRSAVKVPSPFLKSQTVAPHTPDFSVDLNKTTSVGLFGEMSRTSRTDVEANLSKPEREVGAGFTLQYKFGTR